MRTLSALDDDTFDKLTQRGLGRMATPCRNCRQAFADLVKKHVVPIDLKDGFSRSAALRRRAAENTLDPKDTNADSPIPIRLNEGDGRAEEHAAEANPYQRQRRT